MAAYPSSLGQKDINCCKHFTVTIGRLNFLPRITALEAEVLLMLKFIESDYGDMALRRQCFLQAVCPLCRARRRKKAKSARKILCRIRNRRRVFYVDRRLLDKGEVHGIDAAENEFMTATNGVCRGEMD